MNQFQSTPLTKSAGPEFDIRAQARALGTVIHAAAGNMIFKEGDPPTTMYVLLSGAVEITSHGKAIEHMLPGDAFGIISLLDDMPRAASARATEDSELALLDRKRFRFMVEETPNFVWFIMHALVNRLRATNAAL
jgi:CRP/FNR family cyclic AMP-dependent transcriptional regulator